MAFYLKYCNGKINVITQNQRDKHKMYEIQNSKIIF